MERVGQKRADEVRPEGLHEQGEPQRDQRPQDEVRFHGRRSRDSA